MNPNSHLSAYPCQPTSPHGEVYSPEFGLTKRELFAAMAMQGWLSGSPQFKDKETGLAVNLNAGNPSHADAMAQGAIAFADALLAALEAAP